MNTLKKNDISKYKYIIIAVVLSVAAIFLVQIFLKSRASKEYSAFVERCDFVRIDAYYIDGKKTATTITDKRIICGLWEIVKKAKLPSRRQKKLYDYVLKLYFVSQDNSQVMISIVKDKGTNEVYLTFHGRRSTFSASGIDEGGLVEEVVQRIIGDNQ
jgi:predicted transcriptional regulator YdeE